jgi:hypothetical protein
MVENGGVLLKEEDVEKVMTIIDDNPLDEFWEPPKDPQDGEPNSCLFEDILKMLNNKGWDLVLVKKVK